MMQKNNSECFFFVFLKRTISCFFLKSKKRFFSNPKKTGRLDYFEKNGFFSTLMLIRSCNLLHGWGE